MMSSERGFAARVQKAVRSRKPTAASRLRKSALALNRTEPVS